MPKHTPRWLASCQAPKESCVCWFEATFCLHKGNRCRWQCQPCRCGILFSAVPTGRAQRPCHFFRLPQGQKMPHSRNGRGGKSGEWERCRPEALWIFSPPLPESYPLILELQKAVVYRASFGFLRSLHFWESILWKLLPTSWKIVSAVLPDRSRSLLEVLAA